MAQQALGWHEIPYHQAFTLPWTGARGADPLEREGRPELLGCTKEMAERGPPGQPSGTAGETDSGRQGAFSGVHGGDGDGTRILLETPAPLLLPLEEPKDQAPRVTAPSVQDHTSRGGRGRQVGLQGKLGTGGAPGTPAEDAKPWLLFAYLPWHRGPRRKTRLLTPWLGVLGCDTKLCVAAIRAQIGQPGIGGWRILTKHDACSLPCAPDLGISCLPASTTQA